MSVSHGCPHSCQQPRGSIAAIVTMHNVATVLFVGPCRFEHTDWAKPKAFNLQKPDPDYRLYAVTDPSCNAKCQRSNVEAVKLAVEGGATLIQLREKNADGGAFVREAQALKDLLRPTGVSTTESKRSLEVMHASEVQT